MNQLKEAEKKASQLVQEARKARVDRMKEAKSEAEQIISSYKAEMEANYQKSLATQTGSSGAAGNELQFSTEKDIQNMGRDFASNKETVEKMLVDHVCTVNTKPPERRQV